MAPAMRKKLQKQIEAAKREEAERLRQKRIQAAEEGDPDAIEQEIKEKIYERKRTSIQIDQPQKREFRSPAITLGTTMAAQAQSEINTADQNWKNQ